MCCLGVATPSAAQEALNQATIAGRVLDPSGAPIAGATVAVRQTDTNVRIEATTDTDGRFRFPYLRIGPYDLTVQFDRFRTASRTLTLSAGSAFDVPITLAVAELDASVTVVAATPALETSRSQIAGTVPQ